MNVPKLKGFLGGLPTVEGKSSKGITHGTRLLFGVGFCGSFTTYSTYAVDVVGMLSKGEVVRGVSYIALNNGKCSRLLVSLFHSTLTPLLHHPVGAITAGLLGFKFAAKVLGR